MTSILARRDYLTRYRTNNGSVGKQRGEFRSARFSGMLVVTVVNNFKNPCRRACKCLAWLGFSVVWNRSLEVSFDRHYADTVVKRQIEETGESTLQRPSTSCTGVCLAITIGCA